MSVNKVAECIKNIHVTISPEAPTEVRGRPAWRQPNLAPVLQLWGAVLILAYTFKPGEGHGSLNIVLYGSINRKRYEELYTNGQWNKEERELSFLQRFLAKQAKRNYTTIHPTASAALLNILSLGLIMT